MTTIKEYANSFIDLPKMPVVGKHYSVRCQGFRCLATFGSDGKWWAVYTKDEVRDVIDFQPA